MKSLLWTVIALREFEMKMVWLKVNHPVVMDCRKKIAIPKSPIYWAKQFTPTDLMGDSSSDAGTRCRTMSDGSQTSFGLFVEGSHG